IDRAAHVSETGRLRLADDLFHPWMDDIRDDRQMRDAYVLQHSCYGREKPNQRGDGADDAGEAAAHAWPLLCRGGRLLRCRIHASCSFLPSWVRNPALHGRVASGE